MNQSEIKSDVFGQCLAAKSESQTSDMIPSRIGKLFPCQHVDGVSRNNFSTQHGLLVRTFHLHEATSGLFNEQNETMKRGRPVPTLSDSAFAQKPSRLKEI